MPKREPRPAVPSPRGRSHPPIRPQGARRPPTIVPDLLVAFAASAWAMAITLAVLSLFKQLTPGGAGQALARLFAASLALSGFFIMGLAIALMRDERNDSIHYVIPGIAGALAGMLETALILSTAGYWLILPIFLFIFVLPPLRNVIEPRRKARR